MTFVELNGKVVGDLVDDIYITRRHVIKHFFNIGQGYPISVNVLDKLKLAGCKKVRIEEQRLDGSIGKYETDIDNYINEKEFQMADFDKQKCYQLKLMQEISS